ncbi:hypothetical protein [Bradyrhizobium sp.]|uniref:hypothetical protein n=1 Tax=Bradyrhizobium sp. TaxID=376 RepID=UPI00271874BC|nr:hypothetical protein [Bradyrhizobium sp.]MDO9297430.1 hypothetical protein [Bradyrhizobium sp.]
MCNLYSLPTNQAAIIAFVRAMREIIGSMPVYPGNPRRRHGPCETRRVMSTALTDDMIYGPKK